MSPEIRIDGLLVARVPDKTGLHEMADGSSLYVNVDGIDADSQAQRIILEAEALGGRRVVGLTLQGIGESDDQKRGDGLQPKISIQLISRPIRISYRDKVWVERARTLAGPNGGGFYHEVKKTYRNPRWIRR